MKLLLSVRGGKKHTQAEAKPFTIRLKEGLFCVTTPMHDDWLQTADYDLRNADAIIQARGTDWEIEFPNDGARSLFKAWLIQANSKAAHGYKTMYP